MSDFPGVSGKDFADQTDMIPPAAASWLPSGMLSWQSNVRRFLNEVYWMLFTAILAACDVQSDSTIPHSFLETAET
jgi:hypothetical protein